MPENSIPPEIPRFRKDIYNPKIAWSAMLDLTQNILDLGQKRDDDQCKKRDIDWEYGEHSYTLIEEKYADYTCFLLITRTLTGLDHDFYYNTSQNTITLAIGDDVVEYPTDQSSLLGQLVHHLQTNPGAGNSQGKDTTWYEHTANTDNNDKFQEIVKQIAVDAVEDQRYSDRLDKILRQDFKLVTARAYMDRTIDIIHMHNPLLSPSLIRWAISEVLKRY